MNLLAEVQETSLICLEPSSGHSYLGDALRIRELFLNLIENGIKYTEEGGSIRIALLRKEPLARTARRARGRAGRNC